jgi:hypothetical protein
MTYYTKPRTFRCQHCGESSPFAKTHVCPWCALRVCCPYGGLCLRCWYKALEVWLRHQERRTQGAGAKASIRFGTQLRFDWEVLQ